MLHILIFHLLLTDSRDSGMSCRCYRLLRKKHLHYTQDSIILGFYSFMVWEWGWRLFAMPFPTPCPRRNRSIVSVSSWKGWNAGAVFPYVPNHASLWASLGSGWKVRTQDPEKLDEEVKSLVTAWRLLEKRREHRQFPLDLIPDPRTLTSCPTFQRLPRAGQEVEEYLVLSCFYLFTYFLNILIFLYGWPHVILYNRHLFIHYLLLL